MRRPASMIRLRVAGVGGDCKRWAAFHPSMATLIRSGKPTSHTIASARSGRMPAGGPVSRVGSGTCWDVVDRVGAILRARLMSSRCRAISIGLPSDQAGCTLS